MIVACYSVNCDIVELEVIW